MNRATRITVATLGTIFGISGMNHGLFETLQGNVPTGGRFISAIGEAQKMWPHGNEPAFTLVPNFLITGLVAMIVGLAIIAWSVGFVQRKNGPAVFLLLFIVLLMFGGGVAQILFFPWIWLVSTRIHSPLEWWRKTLPASIQEPLGRLWPWCLLLSSILLIFALGIAVTGFVPAVRDPETVLSVMFLFLVAEAVLLPLTFISGFARDMAMRPVPASDK